MGRGGGDEVDVGDISPDAWRLLRVAAGFEQRTIERKLDDIMQAHVSMLENDTRSLSRDRLDQLFELYRTNLTDEQIRVLVEHF
ncbi:hypothetical protein [Halobellus rubicundus]|uniref:XRE family transcriptional regulator n=1 Tax=Halobellus rubicundus TaxID=2996466 RepID=A0ABD5MDL1_9EURY